MIAGGTEVMPSVTTRASGVARLVSVHRAGLTGIEVHEGRARVGAATTLAQLGRDERLAVLRPVVESIASPTIRNLATVGGNLFVEQPYGDLAVALLALAAEADVTGPAEAASRPVADVLNGGVGPREAVTAVAFDVPAPGEWFYTKACAGGRTRHRSSQWPPSWRSRTGRLPRSGSRSAAWAPGRCVPLPPRRRWRGVPSTFRMSGSQRAHSADLLRFAHEVVRRTERAEVFTFGTRLTRVTRQLDTPDVDRALGAVSAIVLDADGGTRIGIALQQFLGDSRLVALARGAVILVMSDGLERGDPAAMADATPRLGRLGHRLVWWSPLACDPAYRPVTRGMHAVLGDLDALAGARDLPTLLRELRGLPAVVARPRRGARRAWAAA